MQVFSNRISSSKTSHIPLNETNATILGALIGNNCGSIRTALLRRLRIRGGNSADQVATPPNSLFLDSLLSPHLRVQETMLLLRLCGIPKFNYICRVVRPAATEDAAFHLDKKIVATVLAKLELCPDSAPSLRDWDHALEQLHLPLKLG